VKFFLGTHLQHWLREVDVPLFVSRRRLVRVQTPPRAVTDWALDSGGFTELSMHGTFTVSALAYAAEVRRFSDEVGRMVWAAPQDWMCEPWIVAKTGLSVVEHQRRTVDNFLTLRAELGPLVIPVLQGWSLEDYDRCADLYASAGIDLAAESTVGLGSVCRRQATDEIGQIVSAMAGRGIRCHGFGVKSDGIALYGHLLTSCDSLAWSYSGRRGGTCTHRKSRCANCLHYALAWRTRVLAAARRPRQMEFDMAGAS